MGVPYFYPRSPCGERRLVLVLHRQQEVISIHALLAESDLWTCCWRRCAGIFLSTLSLRRATARKQERGGYHGISIHALLAESDLAAQYTNTMLGYFYPRSPCGERPLQNLIRYTQHQHFYPRSPCGERRRRKSTLLPGMCNFYPRSPCGERRFFACSNITPLIFLSTLSLRRATRLDRAG